jgi:mitogen-activated protein kinase kinase kinase
MTGGACQRERCVPGLYASGGAAKHGRLISVFVPDCAAKHVRLFVPDGAAKHVCCPPPMSQPSSPASPNAQARSFIHMASSSARCLLDPPHGISFADFVRSWSDAHVARWLADIKCAAYSQTFKTHDIRGDIILDLDHVSLIELGVSAIGDRLRILNAIKSLRQRAQGRSTPSLSLSWPPKQADAVGQSPQERSETSPSKRRLDVGRPAPLQLQPNSRGSLPDIIRDQQPDSARTTAQTVRPLPQPGVVTLPLPGPSAVSSLTPVSSRSNLPPPPPPPRGVPPPPPSGTRTPRNTNGRRTPTPSDSASPYAAYSALGYQSSQELRTPNKSSPLSSRTYLNPGSHPAHSRNGSLQVPAQAPSNVPNKLPPRPSTTPTSTHPYANVQPALQIPSGPQGLSPITESFATPHSSTSSSPSPSSQPHTNLRVGHSPSHHNAPSLGDLRWKLVKFILPDEESSFTIDVTSCANGIEVLEKVLRKFGKSSRNPDRHTEQMQTEGGLTIDGWGVYLETGDDTPGMHTFIFEDKSVDNGQANP